MNTSFTNNTKSCYNNRQKRKSNKCKSSSQKYQNGKINNEITNVPTVDDKNLSNSILQSNKIRPQQKLQYRKKFNEKVIKNKTKIECESSNKDENISINDLKVTQNNETKNYLQSEPIVNQQYPTIQNTIPDVKVSAAAAAAATIEIATKLSTTATAINQLISRNVYLSTLSTLAANNSNNMDSTKNPMDFIKSSTKLTENETITSRQEQNNNNNIGANVRKISDTYDNPNPGGGATNYKRKPFPYKPQNRVNHSQTFHSPTGLISASTSFQRQQHQQRTFEKQLLQQTILQRQLLQQQMWRQKISQTVLLQYSGLNLLQQQQQQQQQQQKQNRLTISANVQSNYDFDSQKGHENFYSKINKTNPNIGKGFLPGNFSNVQRMNFRYQNNMRRNNNHNNNNNNNVNGWNNLNRMKKSNYNNNNNNINNITNRIKNENVNYDNITTSDTNNNVEESICEKEEEIAGNSQNPIPCKKVKNSEQNNNFDEILKNKDNNNWHKRGCENFRTLIYIQSNKQLNESSTIGDDDILDECTLTSNTNNDYNDQTKTSISISGSSEFTSSQSSSMSSLVHNISSPQSDNKESSIFDDELLTSYIYSGYREHNVQSDQRKIMARSPAERYLKNVEKFTKPSLQYRNFGSDTLSKAMWGMYLDTLPTKETFVNKMNLWTSLFLLIRQRYPDFSVFMIGSTISGFGQNTSDVDLCISYKVLGNDDPRSDALQALHNIMTVIRDSRIFTPPQLIQAKVPIIRFRHIQTNLEVDLNYNNYASIRNTHLLYCYSILDWRVRPLVLVVKNWAKYHRINDAKNRTISSYSLVLMVINFLQCGVSPPVVPCLHCINPYHFTVMTSPNDLGSVKPLMHIKPYNSRNTMSLGELLQNFFAYYSIFDFSTFAISVRTGRTLQVKDCMYKNWPINKPNEWAFLCVEEPFNLTNTARACYDRRAFEYITNVFYVSGKVLQITNNLISILQPLTVLDNILMEHYEQNSKNIAQWHGPGKRNHQ